MSYLDMCLKGDGDFEGLFEVTGNEGQKKLKEIFCSRLGSFTWVCKSTSLHWNEFI